ncbi:hypothetical protein [Phenylobacterium aquaticum]|nr:hypothetical protein [Phenylobacterium aquaticum]MCI3132072.1 hypothetical protein [Phenylobacterium aquaticum]
MARGIELVRELQKLGDLPIAYLAVFLGFGALALAAFAIHAVTKARPK